ncbi:hemerythrin domain-containing protein [Sphingomonas sp. Root241]|uniref:hemerythrin domain-containing protein n=1 Tax=Sphingomonas sp. Root241 TaxID=1736501 RepID=UPI002286940A|nr:hemerythrin domain-containing protein [Sphingomonas sp. Root241]
MGDERVIEGLCAEHRALEAQAAQLLSIVSAPVPDAAAVAAMRWRMAQALFDHCNREDWLIYDRLLFSGDAVATRIAWLYRQEHGLLGPSFANYVATWPVDRITKEWERFRAETRILMAGLAERIKREEEVLYPHAERVIARRQAAA